MAIILRKKTSKENQGQQTSILLKLIGKYLSRAKLEIIIFQTKIILVLDNMIILAFMRKKVLMNRAIAQCFCQKCQTVKM